MRIIRQWLTDREGSGGRDILSLTLLFGIIFFQALGRFPLLDPDEGRYAEIPREMLERWDFVTPCLNYVKYFEKPPLHYWLNALAMSIFGRNEFSARLPGAAMGLLTIVVTYHAGRKLYGRRAGVISAVMLGTSLGFCALARLDITDMTLTCTLSASLIFFMLATREGEKRKGTCYHLGYACAALAVLAKGLIGLLFPGAIIFLYLLLTRRWRLLAEMRLATGIPLFLAVAAPWFVLVSLRNPEFARFFFIHEHFERFTSTVHGRFQPFWYFIPVLAGTMLPWSLYIPTALRGRWRDRKTGTGDSLLYLAIWAVFIFFFFSKSNSKLIPYILPTFPPLALLAGEKVAAVMDGEFTPLALPSYLAGGILCLIGGCLALYPHLAGDPLLTGTGGTVIGLLFIVQGGWAVAAARKKDVLVLVIGLALCSCLIETAAPPFVLPALGGWRSSRDMGLLAARLAPPGATIASIGLDQGLSFYARRRIMVIGDPNELEFGSRQGDNSAWFLDVPRFSRLWHGTAPVYLVISDMELAYLKNIITPPFTVLGRTRRKMLITNR